MRQVVLDTETTGLEVTQGHRVIEIGCVELVDRKHTNSEFHCYLNPDRQVDAGAQEVHGISQEFLRDKPRFPDIAEDFLTYVKGAQLIIHNAPFDVGFLDAELRRYDRRVGRLADHCEIVDSLATARDLHPGQRNSLDALCARYEVDNSQRDHHGAVLDARLLADVYLLMTGGQTALALNTDESPKNLSQRKPRRRVEGELRVVRASEAELLEHRQRLSVIDTLSDGNCLWKGLEEA